MFLSVWGGVLVSSQNDAIGGYVLLTSCVYIYSAHVIISYVSFAVVSVFQASVEQITDVMSLHDGDFLRGWCTL